MEEIEEVKELKERYKMYIEKLKSILEERRIIERIVDVYEKTLQKEELEKILIYEIPELKKDLLFLMRVIDIQASLVRSLLVIYKQDKKLIEESFFVIHKK